MNRPIKLGLALTGAAFFAAAAGCNIVGPAVVLIHGPEKQAASFTLDDKLTTVVFVDDRGNRLDRRSLRLTIAKNATDILLKDGGLKKVVDPSAPLTRVSGEGSEEPTAIATLGKSVGADIVIYATVDAFTLSEDSVTFKPSAVLRVKVLDCNNEPARLWPEEKAGKTITVEVATRHGAAPKNGSDYAKAQENLAKECGRAIAELFYKHQIQRRVQETNDRGGGG